MEIRNRFYSLAWTRIYITKGCENREKNCVWRKYISSSEDVERSWNCRNYSMSTKNFLTEDSFSGEGVKFLEMSLHFRWTEWDGQREGKKFKKIDAFDGSLKMWVSSFYWSVEKERERKKHFVIWKATKKLVKFNLRNDFSTLLLFRRRPENVIWWVEEGRESSMLKNDDDE